jgi:hypothetical protein
MAWGAGDTTMMDNETESCLCAIHSLMVEMDIQKIITPIIQRSSKSLHDLVRAHLEGELYLDCDHPCHTRP